MRSFLDALAEFDLVRFPDSLERRQMEGVFQDGKGKGAKKCLKKYGLLPNHLCDTSLVSYTLSSFELE